MTLFIESLTLRTWWRAILPSLRRQRGDTARRWYVIDASRPGLAVGRLTARVTGACLERLRVRVADLRDAQGCSLWLRTLYQDLLAVHAEVMAEPAFRRFAAEAACPSHPRLPLYAAKVLSQATARLLDRHTLWRALLVIQLCAWTARTAGRCHGRVMCFLEPRPGMPALARYASRYGVTVVPARAGRGPRARLKASVPGWLLDMLVWGRQWWRAARRGLAAGPGPAASAPQTAPARRSASGGARIVVEYYGHLNLSRPERYSDLLFWQQSSLPARAILVTFNLPEAPLDAAKWAELTAHGMSAVALRPEATTVPHAPVMAPVRWRDGHQLREPVARLPRTAEGRWLREQVHGYARTRAWWTRFFAPQRVKLYVSWFKSAETHCAIADALEELGGVTAMYQRSYEALPLAQMSTAADIVFGFSAESADTERRSGSRIPYFIVTGYLGDHRAPLLRDQAVAVRRRLEQHGAARIIAFCDENSYDEERWAPGHGPTRESYAFWIEHVLRHPWLGLLVKPKTPRSLRQRLGPIASLLAQAEATGRCVVFEGGEIQGSYPPTAAALAADVLVHGHLWAATAGVESALAGVPTLMMDREGWPVSPFYRLGVGRVVFTDWPALWQACQEHWNRQGGIPGFGDWSPILHELDPFRDGHAAERMGAYLQWLLEGFDAGLDRATVMADAAERYAARWGRDKVAHVNWSGHPGSAAVQRGEMPTEALPAS